jgi:hypothetical protein
MILRNRLIFACARVSLVFEGHLCDGRARAAFEQRKRRRSNHHPALPPRKPHNVTNDTGNPPSLLAAEKYAIARRFGRLQGMQQEGGKAGRFGDCSERVIGACIEVHRWLGPGLLESAYERCLAHEFGLCRLSFERQIHLPRHLQGHGGRLWVSTRSCRGA